MSYYKQHKRRDIRTKATINVDKQIVTNLKLTKMLTKLNNEGNTDIEQNRHMSQPECYAAK